MRKTSALLIAAFALVGSMRALQAVDTYAYEIQYLESTGVQFIDTGIKPTSKTMFKGTYQYVSQCKGAGGNCDMIAGVRTTSAAATRYYPVSLNSAFPNERYVLSSQQGAVNYSSATRHDIVFNDGSRRVWLDGKLIYTFSSSFANASRNLYLFAGNSEQTAKPGNADWYANARIYGCEIWEGEVLVRHFIPVVDANGVACMFDTVSQTLFRNGRTDASTAPFKAGPRKAAYLYETEFLKATSGTEYIDTGVYANSNVETRVGYRYDVVTQPGNAMIGGSQSPDRYYPISLTGTSALKNERYVWGTQQFEKTLPSLCHHEVIFNDANHKIWLDGNFVGTGTVQVRQSTRPMLIFAASQTASPYHNWHAKASVWHYEIYEKGLLARAFIPVVDENGAACFYDRVSNALFKNQGTGSFTPGRIISPVVTLDLSARTDLAANLKVLAWTLTPAPTTRFVLDATTAQAWDVERRVDGAYLVAKDPAIPLTASWTGTAGDGNATNPANWLCKDAGGSPLTDALPAARTVIEVTGATSIPLATLPPCQAVTFAGTVRLTADCDWQGLGTFVVPDNLTIDLAGHNLTLAGFVTRPATYATFTDTSAAGAGGTLRVVVNDELIRNENVRLSGSLRFVKDGPGTFLAARANQSYTGGTAVLGGILKSETGDDVYNRAFGFDAARDETRMEIGAGAIFDLNGTVNGKFAYTLAGGTLMNGGSRVRSDWNQVVTNAIDLVANSVVSNRDFALIAPSWKPVTVKMNGNTLRSATVSSSGNVFSFANTTFEGEGTIEVQSGWIGPTNANYACIGRNLTLSYAGTAGGIWLRAPLTVSNFIFRAQAISGSSLLTILGRYHVKSDKPDNHPNIALASGATLDLHELTGAQFPFKIQSPLNSTYVQFPEDGRITIDLAGSASATNGLHVLAWHQSTTFAGSPCEFDFVLDATTASAGLMLVRKTDGLYLVTRDDRAVKTAEWTGEAANGDVNDPANWSCTGFDGAPVTGVPGPLTTILVRNTTSLTYSDQLVYGRFLVRGAVELAGDCDWRGFGSLFLGTGTVIDLKGHDLTLCNYTGTVEVQVDQFPIGFTDSSEQGGTFTLDLAEGATLSNNRPSFSGSLKFMLTGNGSFGSNRSQSYTGGTEVRGGRLFPYMAGTSTPFGDTNATIVVREGATFDFNGKAGFQNYSFVLDGGTLANNAGDLSGSAVVKDFVLTKDSILSVPRGLQIGTGAADSCLALNNHELTVNLSGGTSLRFNVAAISNGVVRVTDGGTLFTPRMIDAATCTFDLACASTLDHPCVVSNLVNRWSGREGSVTYGGGMSAYKVLDTFTPVSNSFCNVELQNGATLDLRGQEGTWSTKSVCDEHGVQYLTVAPGASIAIDVTGRTDLTNGMQLVSWDMPEALHRWSFNGDWSDSVGGVTAMPQGTARLENGGVARTLGGTHGSSYIDLGTTLTLPTNEAVTVEMWVTEHSFQKWAKLLMVGTVAGKSDFAFGGCNASGASCDFTIYGATGNRAGADKGALSLDRRYYLSAVIHTRNSADQTTVIWRCHDATTGEELYRMDSGKMAWNLGLINEVPWKLGWSAWSADNDADASFDEVRITRGAFTETELAASLLAGPDTYVANRRSAFMPQLVKAGAGRRFVCATKDDGIYLKVNEFMILLR
ncbi:MAG: hypothetical protein MJ249_08720 [Kiritimatiellae bacterium]|nr:hypothetical protein [Kiritimatiellia bacterium]